MIPLYNFRNTREWNRWHLYFNIFFTPPTRERQIAFTNVNIIDEFTRWVVMKFSTILLNLDSTKNSCDNFELCDLHPAAVVEQRSRMPATIRLAFNYLALCVKSRACFSGINVSLPCAWSPCCIQHSITYYPTLQSFITVDIPFMTLVL